MVMMAGYDLPLRAIRQHISAALDLLVHIERMEDGSRRVTQVVEVLRMESDVITLQDLFTAKPPDEESAGTSRGGRLLSPLSCTGLKPHFLEKMAASGVLLPPTFFRPAEGGARPTFAAAPYGNV
jgi:pilus assembly protein CpaF